MQREYIQVSREFGRDHAVIPKRLTQLALTTLDILQRVDKLIPHVEGTYPHPHRTCASAACCVVGIISACLLVSVAVGAVGCPLKRSVGILLDLLQGLPPYPNVSIAELFPSIKVGITETDTHIDRRVCGFVCVCVCVCAQEKNDLARHPDHDYSVGALFTVT